MNELLLAAAGNSSSTYIEDVFSTYLYTGNGGTQTINNGIDLAGKGGLVWIKDRTIARSNILLDTVQGVNNYLETDQTAQQQNAAFNFVFNNNGFSQNNTLGISNSNTAESYASWTFRKAPKFFDIVQYTGDGTTNRSIPHKLGSVPGMIITKSTTDSTNWYTYHQSLGATQYVALNSTSAATATTMFGNHTSTNFVVTGNGTGTNNVGSQYIAYLFAHDPSPDGLIQCGSFTTDASGNATVNLGWEPQYVLYRASSTTSNWAMADNMRGLPVTGNTSMLLANTTGSETSSANQPVPTATGFTISGGIASSTFIYMAIRRGPMRIPSSGSKVCLTVTRAGTSAATTITNSAMVAPDLVIVRARSGQGGPAWFDKLRGNDLQLASNNNNGNFAESNANTGVTSFIQNGYTLGADGSAIYNTSGTNYVDWVFQRYPGVFDIVCYTGTGSPATINHNLGVNPELIITRSRSVANSWYLYFSSLGFGQGLTFSSAADSSTTCPVTATTTTTFTTNSNSDTSATYVAYLFASRGGVSKVFNYTGNGTTQTINCGFSNGARFVMVKMASGTGNFYVFDTQRGITAPSTTDPYVYMDSFVVEANGDFIDSDPSGFVSKSVINQTGQTYVGIAFA